MSTILKGQKGYTLHEFLLACAAVAIIFTAIIRPWQAQVEEAEIVQAENEKIAIQLGVAMMMVDMQIASLNNPVPTPTNDMANFPDNLTEWGQNGKGYRLFDHDTDGNGQPDNSYITTQFTEYTYTCDKNGMVTQHFKFPSKQAIASTDLPPKRSPVTELVFILVEHTSQGLCSGDYNQILKLNGMEYLYA